MALIGALCSAALAFWRAPLAPRYWPLLAIAAVPQIGSLFGITIPGMLFGAMLAVLIWSFCNRAVRGAAIIGLGAGLNLLVMAFHGGAMPIRADVLAAIGQIAAPGTLLAGSKDVVIQTSPFWLLSDWIVVSLGASTIVASPGDLVVVVGIVYWLLFSRQSEKDNSHVDIGRNSDVAGTTFAATTRPK